MDSFWASRPFFPKIGNQEEVVRLDVIEGRRIIEIKAALWALKKKNYRKLIPRKYFIFWFEVFFFWNSNSKRKVFVFIFQKLCFISVQKWSYNHRITPKYLSIVGRYIEYSWSQILIWLMSHQSIKKKSERSFSKTLLRSFPIFEYTEYPF